MRKQTRFLLAAAASATLPAALASAQTFIGQNFTASRSLVDGLRYDYTGAAGTDYYVELTGGRYGVYRKSDGVRVETSNLETFWASAGAPHAGDRAFDPRVVYDPYARRFYAISADNFDPAVGAGHPNSFMLAVSNSADPRAGWTGFKIDSDSNNDRWADFPAIGFNRDVVTLSANMFLDGSSSPPAATTFLVIPKADLLAPTPTVANATKFEELSVNSTGFTVQPAVDMDNGALPLPMLARLNSTTLKRTTFTGTPGSPSPVTTGGLIPVSANLDPPTANQPGPKPDIWTNDNTRFSGNVVRNNGELWGVHTVGLNGRAALRWYRINEATNAVIESGHLSDPSLAFFFGSIAVNDSGDVVIGMSGTAPESAADPDGTFVSAFAAVGKTTGGVTTFGTPFITKEGVSDYELLDGAGRNRWGDYSATTLDPADPSIFWTIQKYVYQTNGRATQVTEIITPQPGEVRWEEPASGGYSTDANWFGGAAPTGTSHVIFSRATDPAGSGYTVSVGADQTVDRFSVRQGKVTLDLAGSTINATNPSAATPGLAVGEYGGAPTLDIVGGTVIADHATLATSPTASAVVNLSGGAKLQIHRNLIGGTDTAPGGDAVLNIDGGSTLQAAQELRVWDGGVVNFNSGIMSTGLLNVSGGRVNVAASGGAKVVRTTGVQTTGGGRIDLTSNAMTIDYAPADGSPLLDVKAQIAGAYAGGAWTGPGIATSHGNASQFGLGYGEAAALNIVPPIFGTVDASTVLVRFTRYGDANLDALVNLDDFNRLAANFGSTAAVWTQGDFTYDMLVNLDDFNRLAANFGLSAAGPEVTPQDWSALASVVPEPGAIETATVTAALSLCGMMARRRRSGATVRRAGNA